LPGRAQESHYRGYLRRQLEPHFGERTLDRIEPEHVEPDGQGSWLTLFLNTVPGSGVRP